jgi:hypothetical protein
MLCVFSEVDTEFLNVIFRKVIKVSNAASVPILRLMDFLFSVIFTGFNFVIDLIYDMCGLTFLVNHVSNLGWKHPIPKFVIDLL